ncbi:MAG: hypothetical protein UU10_C0006G0009 [Parcubacteria group bacterium GW2011_GWF1_40_6]|nr:MAG: hypothetical protein UU10_C0006G0009 [Parcubacteria group bacterium GW2011_GWF1_40_6]
MVVPHVDRALLVSVEDSLGVAIDGASVQLQKDIFDQTKTTNSLTCATPGQAFWNGLDGGIYTLTVSKAGYTTSVGTVDVSLPWQNQSIILLPETP